MYFETTLIQQSIFNPSSTTKAVRRRRRRHPKRHAKRFHNPDGTQRNGAFESAPSSPGSISPIRKSRLDNWIEKIREGLSKTQRRRRRTRKWIASSQVKRRRQLRSSSESITETSQSSKQVQMEANLEQQTLEQPSKKTKRRAESPCWMIGKSVTMRDSLSSLELGRSSGDIVPPKKFKLDPEFDESNQRAGVKKHKRWLDCSNNSDVDEEHQERQDSLESEIETPRKYYSHKKPRLKEEEGTADTQILKEMQNLKLTSFNQCSPSQSLLLSPKVDSTTKALQTSERAFRSRYQRQSFPRTTFNPNQQMLK